MRRRAARLGAGISIVLAATALAGCGEDQPETSTAIPVPPVVDLPASSAGGACQLLDYATIAETTGGVFDVAAASASGGSQSCVIRSETARHPELSLSVTKTTADVSVFKEELVPAGGKTVSGLGKAAYRTTLAPAKGHGAAAEIGWLTGDGRLLNLRYVLTTGEDRAAADTVAGKLVALAKQIDVSSL